MAISWVSMGFPNDCNKSRELLRAMFAEFLSMTLFLFFGTGSVIATGEFLTQDGVARENTVGRLMPIAMAFGMTIMVLVYSTGNLSGGHINPAVTLFLCLIQQISPPRAVAYIIAQLLGAVLGSALTWGATSGMGSDDVGSPPFALGANSLNSDLTSGNGFLFEMMGTFLLCLVILLTAVRGGGPTDGQPNLAPLCIGFSIFIAHIVLIPFTGCGINPARTFGPAVVNSFAGDNLWDSWSWIYYVGPGVGAVLAAMCYLVFVEEDEGDVSSNADVHKYHMPENAKSTGYRVESDSETDEEPVDDTMKDKDVEMVKQKRRHKKKLRNVNKEIAEGIKTVEPSSISQI
mmetsp:Transcript_8583/g.12812  ORF Transcript_8583/g.12812 Transcript_8583/m.12812 type:complete len:346 (+) Transcript_8583:48-1085(+)